MKEEIRWYLFVKKLCFIDYLKESKFVTIRTPQNNVWLSCIKVARDEELLITDEYKIVKQKSKYFIKNWKWRLYELLYIKLSILLRTVPILCRE